MGEILNMSYQEYLGLRKLRLGSLFAAIAMILSFAGAMLGYMTIMTLLTLLISVGPVTGFTVLLITIAVIAFVGIGLGLFSIFQMLSGFNTLSSVFEEAKTGRWGAIFLLVGFVLFLLYPIGLVLLFAKILAGLGIAIGGLVVGIILIIIGSILVGIGYHRTGVKYNENTVNVGGIVMTLVPFVGFIMTYVGLGYLLRKPPFSQMAYQPMFQPPMQPVIPQQQPMAPQQQQLLPIYQFGSNGVMAPNGIASFQVKADYPAQLISATIEGTNYTSTSITPNFIQPNQPITVTVNFGNVQLAPGKQYRIFITAVVNNSQVQFPVYVTS